MKKAAKRGGVREGAGRKPTPEADALRVGSIRLTAAQWDKLARLGGVAWLRERIYKARNAVSCAGRGAGDGCGYNVGNSGNTCPRCGGMLLSDSAADKAARLASAWAKRGAP